MGERSDRRKIVPGGAYPTDVMQTVSTPPPVPAFLATPSSPKAEVAPALVCAEGPLAQGARVHVDPDEVVVLVRDGAVDGVLTAPIFNYDERRVYARVEVELRNGVYYAAPTGPQGSNILTSMSRANGLAICPEDLPSKNAGETVRILMLDWNEEVDI